MTKLFRAMLFAITLLAYSAGYAQVGTTATTESESESAEADAEAKRKKEISDEIDRMAKGELETELEIGVFSYARTVTQKRYSRIQIKDSVYERILQDPDPNLEQVKKLIESDKTPKNIKYNIGLSQVKSSADYTLGEWTSPFKYHGYLDLGVYTNFDVYGYIKPTIKLYLNYRIHELFLAKECNCQDIPSFYATVSPHYFSPLKNELWELLGVDMKRNMGTLFLDTFYQFGYRYSDTEVVLSNPIGVSLAHANFDPLGVIPLFYGVEFRAHNTSTFSLATTAKRINQPDQFGATFTIDPRLTLTKYFGDKTQLVKFSLTHPVRTLGAPLGDVLSNGFAALRENTIAYQSVRLQYLYFWHKKSTFFLEGTFARDAVPFIRGKKVLEPTAVYSWQLIANLTWQL